MKFLVFAAAFAGAGLGVFAADPFAEGVRPTEPLTPEEQLKTFKLPPGFQVQLVAAEPDLQKPMNMAFDARGRLWVSMSREYPFPAPVDKGGRDMIRIFEDFDENGRARKSTTFAEGLNIPIGIYPYKNGAIGWSIPNIWYFEDTDGDDKADRKTVLFGPLGWERDTHGNQASFRRGFDGWMYATHGYNNISTFKAKDGSEIRLHSGNTYRFRTDAGRIEQHTWGQVNPFGLAFDPAGNMYSADCHSAPIYELLRGGWYPSFGKPHDGLGFAPTMLEHSHGSTAICGIIFYADNLWPAEYQNNIIIGNVMTSRVNRDTLVERGSSKTAREEPDFVTTSDPWFRPVDLQLGPDGALYIADFYNRIIGHYEVPLQHPGRDRERGRIWRITYEGKTHGLPDWRNATLEELAAQTGHPNPTRRLLALNEVFDRGFSGEEVGRVFSKLLDTSKNPHQLIAAGWAMQRAGKLDLSAVSRLASHSDRTVRTHLQRILAEDRSLDGGKRLDQIIAGLNDADALVRRTACEGASQHPDARLVPVLLAALRKTPGEDDHLRHSLRMALRDQFRGEHGGLLQSMTFSDAEVREVASVCLGLPTRESAGFLIRQLEAGKSLPGQPAEYVRHAARYIDQEGLEPMARFIRSRFANNLDQQLAFFKAVQEGSTQRGLTIEGETRSWAAELAAKLLDSAQSENLPWRNFPAEDRPSSANPWFVQQRPSADGNKTARFLSSLPPGGEHLTGVLRSRAFKIPAKLSFYLAGHDGLPQQPANGNNLVRLVAARDGSVLATAVPPRNDTAQKIEWDLKDVAGADGWIELIDRDTGSGYAWLAAGRFEPAVVPVPSINPNQLSARIEAAAEMARTLKLQELAEAMGKLLGSGLAEPQAQGALASAMVALAPNETRLALAPLAGDSTVSPELRARIGQVLAQGDRQDALPVLVEAIQTTPARVQSKLAQSLSSSEKGAETLLKLVERKDATPYVLLDKTVQDKFAALPGSNLLERLRALTKNLPPQSEQMDKLIEQRRASFNAARAEAAQGAIVYANNCAVCHQIDGEGSLVGPQLDGIANRGLERLLEDILDPNRNVDINFRTHVFVTQDGDVVSGLLRREEGELFVLADSTGKEISLPKSQVESRRESATSLMPSNFGDVLSEADLQNLLAFLMRKSQLGAK